MRSYRIAACLVVGTCAAACTKQSVDAGAPHVTDDSARRPPAPSAETSATTASGAAADAAVASPRDAGATGAAGGDASSSTAAADAPVHVKLATIGMHVGGGPYDEITKEPIKRSVEPHFPELARCWKHIAKPQPTEVGVDLVIEAGGGRARVSNPRSFAKDEGFVPCVVSFFETVEFLKPMNGKTVVSYSVRFTP